VPSDLTIFAAKYLVFIDALIAVVVIAYVLWKRPRIDVVRWAAATAIMLVLSYVFAHLGSAVYSDPRPFAVDHVRPLIPHARDNGFPSDHALLAAAIVAAVLFASPLWAVLFVVLGFLVDWARVGAGLHHVVDVLGSTGFVLMAAAIAMFVAPYISRWLALHVDRRPSAEEAASSP
jgi:undecaprenyl-diphosphatase